MTIHSVISEPHLIALMFWKLKPENSYFLFSSLQTTINNMSFHAEGVSLEVSAHMLASYTEQR